MARTVAKGRPGVTVSWRAQRRPLAALLNLLRAPMLLLGLVLPAIVAVGWPPPSDAGVLLFLALAEAGMLMGSLVGYFGLWEAAYALDGLERVSVSPEALVVKGTALGLTLERRRLPVLGASVRALPEGGLELGTSWGAVRVGQGLEPEEAAKAADTLSRVVLDVQALAKEGRLLTGEARFGYPYGR